MTSNRTKPLSDSNLHNIAFCSFCGGHLEEVVVEGRSRKRCVQCGRINYVNPTPAVGLLAARQPNLVMLVRRTVPPEIGHWCLPGGFIEMGETPEDAVHRELLEETGLRCTIDRLFDVGTVINGFYGDVIVLAYVITIAGGTPRAGDDADRIDYFPASDLPPIAFKSHVRFIERLCNIEVNQHPRY
jgi:8-oxo-dGTP diphosphatase